MKSKLYYKFKQKMQDNRGFTMAEVLTVVAILSILMAITFVAIFHYYQTLKLNEMDGTAKEIYIAAQNHLSYAKSTGKLDEVNKLSTSVMKTKPSDWDSKKDWVEGDNSPYRYLIINENTADNTVLKYILPNGSIDGTVRDGHYIIEYNVETAKVYGVFYSEKVAFSSSDEDNNSLNQTKEDTRVRPNSTNNGHTGRINYGKNNQTTHEEYKPGLINGIIGYYGGSNINLPTKKIDKDISLQLLNNNKLTARITVKGYYAAKTEDQINYQYELHVRGKTSGVTRTFLLQLDEKNTTDGVHLSLDEKQKSYDLITLIKKDNDNLTIDFYLDDITKPGGHFSELGRGWIPGEDITAWVDVSGRSVGSGSSGKVGVITGIKRVAAKDSVNSLFDYVKVDSSDPQNKTAEVGISNIRNLENLDKTVSNLGMKNEQFNFSTSNQKSNDHVDYKITSAVQEDYKEDGKTVNSEKNLDWEKFVESIKDSDNQIRKNLNGDAEVKRDKEVHVYDYDVNDVFPETKSNATLERKDVKASYTRTTDNAFRSIDVKKITNWSKKYGDGVNDQVKDSYDNPLKSYDGQNHQIKNLSITGKSETENHAHDEDHPAGLFGTVDLSGDFAVKNLTLVDTNISAQSTAGALIGKSDNTALMIEKVSAQSKDKSIESNNAVAGGLIGTVDSGNINVRDSFSTMIVKGKTYAGGLIGETHGSGSISNSYVGGHTKDGKYDNKNYNITADDGVAAGFIANADNQLKINNCYSTASAKGATASPFVAQKEASDYSDCYAIGLYKNGNDDAKQDKIDQKFVTNSVTSDATLAYDGSLQGKAYPYKTVTQTTIGDKSYDHVGDWEEITDNGSGDIIADPPSGSSILSNNMWIKLSYKGQESTHFYFTFDGSDPVIGASNTYDSWNGFSLSNYSADELHLKDDNSVIIKISASERVQDGGEKLIGDIQPIIYYYNNLIPIWYVQIYSDWNTIRPGMTVGQVKSALINRQNTYTIEKIAILLNSKELNDASVVEERNYQMVIYLKANVGNGFAEPKNNPDGKMLSADIQGQSINSNNFTFSNNDKNVTIRCSLQVTKSN